MSQFFWQRPRPYHLLIFLEGSFGEFQADSLVICILRSSQELAKVQVRGDKDCRMLMLHDAVVVFFFLMPVALFRGKNYTHLPQQKSWKSCERLSSSLIRYFHLKKIPSVFFGAINGRSESISLNGSGHSPPSTLYPQRIYLDLLDGKS